MARSATSPNVFKGRRKNQIEAGSRELDRVESDSLIRRIEAMIAPWEAAEPSRRKRDKVGARMMRGQNFMDSISESRMMIRSNTAVAVGDRVTSEVMRAMPEPEIEAVNQEEEDAARLAEGAIRANWKNDRMREKMANGYRQAMFTRQIGFYHYWRPDALGGIGDVAHMKLSGHRLIFDNSKEATQDMEYVGFELPYRRSKLISMYPDKVNEIEDAMQASDGRVTSVDTDPLEELPKAGNASRVYDRLITTAGTQTGPYQAVTSIASSLKRRGQDPLSEEVMVRFMWIRDYSVKRAKKARIDPRTKRPMFAIDRDETGRMQFEDHGHEVIHTSLGPQYVPKKSPKVAIVMDDVIVPKYPQWRHVVYIKGDRVNLWDVNWDAKLPISILRDRYPAIGFHAEGTGLRLLSLTSARDVLWTIIFERLRKSMRGTWMTTPGSGLKRNMLVNEIGKVFTINQVDQIKEFPSQPLEPGYFQLLNIAEQEIEMLMGVTPMMKGQAVGRADSPQTYEQVADQSGGPILDRAKIIDQWVQDAVEIDLWFMQNRYTHEHVVEAETAEGFSTWTEASGLAIRGKFSIKVETGSTMGRSTTRDRADAEEAANLGFYALPTLGRLGHFRHWKKGLKQKSAIIAQGPQYAYLLGPGGAGPNQQAMNVRSKTQRSHHKPGGK